MSPTSTQGASKTSLLLKKDQTPKIELNTGVLHFVSNSPLDAGISKKVLNKSPLMKNRKYSTNN